MLIHKTQNSMSCFQLICPVSTLGIYTATVLSTTIYKTTKSKFKNSHAWPDNWQAVDEQFERTWISQHAADATKVLKKPLLMEEWGKWVNATAADSTLADRTKFMQIAFDEIEKQMSTPGNALQGSAFWQWYQGKQLATFSCCLYYYSYILSYRTIY